MGLYNIGPGIWGADHTINRLGLPLTTRMTVMLLDGGGLALHSPCSLEATVGDLQRLGPVTHLIAPNNVHHMFVDQFRAAFPDALLCVSEGLIPKHPGWKGLPNLRVLPRWNPAAASEATVGGGQPSSAGQPSQQQPPSATGAGLGSGPQPYPLPGTTHGEVQCLYVYGNKNDETAFYHVPSRSLVITDTAMHLGSEQALPTRLFAKATGSFDHLSVPAPLKFGLYNKAQGKQSITSMLNQWDFDRVVPTHGNVVQDHGKEAMREAFNWMGVH